MSSFRISFWAGLPPEHSLAFFPFFCYEWYYAFAVLVKTPLWQLRSYFDSHRHALLRDVRHSLNELVLRKVFPGFSRHAQRVTRCIPSLNLAFSLSAFPQEPKDDKRVASRGLSTQCRRFSLEAPPPVSRGICEVFFSLILLCCF